MGLGFLKKIIPLKTKGAIVDAVIDGRWKKFIKWVKSFFPQEAPKPQEREVISPKTPFNTSRLDLRREEQSKKKKRKP